MTVMAHFVLSENAHYSQNVKINAPAYLELRTLSE